jgi:hypothetical protein
MRLRRLKPGDYVIYQHYVHGNAPARHAKRIRPSLHGELYAYVVDELWVVRELREQGRLLLCSYNGQLRSIAASDPLLRVPTFLDRLRYHLQGSGLQRP